MGASPQFGGGKQEGKERRFEQIIGEGPALEAVLEQVGRVAPTDSTVLIQGETGTGKELIAHAIHNISSRCGKAFVRLNCAAIPLDLLESELFGHEKGAFTGAIAHKMGRFELADKGTLFLDEVGDIPLSLQPKLLRVLQEQEFERLGSGRTHKVDVRLVAATHRDLTEMVKQGEFRSDLYYRLNVFPVLLPPLRARSEDIPALVMHFVEMFGHRMGKPVDHIPTATMSALCSYQWPGEPDRTSSDPFKRWRAPESFAAVRDAGSHDPTRGNHFEGLRARHHSANTGTSRLGNRRPKRGCRQTWLEAHHAHPQNAQAGDFSASSAEQPGWGGASTGATRLAAVNLIHCV